MKNRNDLFLQVGRLHRVAVKLFARGLKDIKMTHGLAAALLHLEHIGDGCNIQSLSSSLEIERPTLVVILQRLEQLNLVEKRPKPGKKRKTQIFLTPEGVETLARINEIYKKTCDTLLKGINPASLKRTTELLEAVYASMLLDDLSRDNNNSVRG